MSSSDNIPRSGNRPCVWGTEAGPIHALCMPLACPLPSRSTTRQPRPSSSRRTFSTSFFGCRLRDLNLSQDFILPIDKIRSVGTRCTQRLWGDFVTDLCGSTLHQSHTPAGLHHLPDSEACLSRHNAKRRNVIQNGMMGRLGFAGPEALTRAASRMPTTAGTAIIVKET